MKSQKEHTEMLETVFETMVERRTSISDRPMEYVTSLAALVQLIERRTPSDDSES